MSDSAVLRLEQFLPYRLSVLANRVSRALSREYAEAFGLTIPEWRVMAVLGAGDARSAEAVSRATAMDKVAVSRAVARLAARRLVLRRRDATDRRRLVLNLSAEGQRTYERIVPLAAAFEKRLADGLRGGRERLIRVLDELDAAASKVV